jgi:hypothetical protein
MKMFYRDVEIHIKLFGPGTKAQKRVYAKKRKVAEEMGIEEARVSGLTVFAFLPSAAPAPSLQMLLAGCRSNSGRHMLRPSRQAP